MAKTPETPSVFNFLSYREFLSDWFEARRAASPKFSHRLFARLAGQKSPSLLLHVIQGKRNLTEATTQAFSQAMKLGAAEAEFFAALVRLDQATTTAERSDAWAQVSASRRFREARSLDTPAFDYLSHWYVVAIREMAARDDFVDDPKWVARQLRPSIKVAEARRALSILFDLGLLAREEDGRVRPADATVVTPHEVVGLAVRNYHRGMLQLARESVDRFGPAERHLGAVTVCISDELLPRLKEEVAAFQERVLDLCDGSDLPADRVLQLQLALFPLTDTRRAPSDSASSDSASSDSASSDSASSDSASNEELS